MVGISVEQWAFGGTVRWTHSIKFEIREMRKHLHWFGLYTTPECAFCSRDGKLDDVCVSCSSCLGGISPALQSVISAQVPATSKAKLRNVASLSAWQL
jgi:hypothetical protein